MNRTIFNAIVVTFSIASVGTLPSLSGQDKPKADKPDVQAVVEKAIKAHGGEALLAKRKAQIAKVKSTLHGEKGKTQYDLTYTFQAPDRLRIEAEDRDAIVVNGDKGWVGDLELPTTQIAQQAESIYVSWVASRFPLKDKEFTLKLLDEVSVNGRPAVGVNVSRKGHGDIKIYFDNETGLMAKIVTRVLSGKSGKEVDQEVVMLEYRKIDDLPVPMKTITKRDGKVYFESEFKELKFFDSLDDKLFAPSKK